MLRPRQQGRRLFLGIESCRTNRSARASLMPSVVSTNQQASFILRFVSSPDALPDARTGTAPHLLWVGPGAHLNPLVHTWLVISNSTTSASTCSCDDKGPAPAVTGGTGYKGTGWRTPMSRRPSSALRTWSKAAAGMAKIMPRLSHGSWRGSGNPGTGCLTVSFVLTIL